MPLILVIITNTFVTLYTFSRYIFANIKSCTFPWFLSEFSSWFGISSVSSNKLIIKGLVSTVISIPLALVVSSLTARHKILKPLPKRDRLLPLQLYTEYVGLGPAGEKFIKELSLGKPSKIRNSNQQGLLGETWKAEQKINKQTNFMTLFFG